MVIASVFLFYFQFFGLESFFFPIVVAFFWECTLKRNRTIPNFFFVAKWRKFAIKKNHWTCSMSLAYSMIPRLFLLLSSITCSQIWQIPLLNDSQITYLTNLKKENRKKKETLDWTQSNKKNLKAQKKPKKKLFFFF